MAKWRGEIITAIGTKSTGAYKSQASIDYAGTFDDVTVQPNANLITAPNASTFYFECEAAVLDAIEADVSYYVEWAEPIPEEVV